MTERRTILMNFDPQLLTFASDTLSHIASEYTYAEFDRWLQLAEASEWQTVAKELKPIQNVFMNPGLPMLAASIHKILEYIFDTHRAALEKEGVSFEGLTSDKFIRTVLECAAKMAANVEGPSLETKPIPLGDQH